MSRPQTMSGIEKPIIFDVSNKSDQAALNDLFAQRKVSTVVDDYEEQLRELWQYNHPDQSVEPGSSERFAQYYQEIINNQPLWQHGRWVYFSWLSTVVHLLEEPAFFLVRTMRNRLLISPEEQRIFYDATVGIAGLSVGNSVALAIVLQGGAKRIRLAEFDRLSLSNLNRIRAGVENLGLPKGIVTARQIYALNPYAEIEWFEDGLREDTLERFVVGPPKLSVIVDEMDSIAMKLLLRQHARANHVPVVMGADCGDNAMIDVERYDHEPQPALFHGRLGAVTFEDLRSLDKIGTGRTIIQHIGMENLSERVFESMNQIGKSLVSWPQLGGAALLNGSAVAYCVRKIITGQPLLETRALLSLDEKFIPK